MDEVLHLQHPRTHRNPEQQDRSGQEKWQQTARHLMMKWRRAQKWVWFHGRRLVHSVHNMAAGNRAVGPVSFLAVSAAMGLALTVSTLYAPSYAVIVDGQTVGVVADESVVAEAMSAVEAQGTRILGYDYTIDSEIDYQFALTLKTDLSEDAVFESYFMGQLGELANELRNYQLVVNDTAVGSLEDLGALNQLLDDLKSSYMTENTISAEFVDQIRVEDVYTTEQLMSLEEMETALRSNTTGETTYTVVKGDTFNGIAYANDMSVSDLQALNPGVNINKLMVGDILNIKEEIPLLSVTTVEDVTYSEAIACPVETVEDASMYKGTSKITTQGVEGEALVNAQVTYVNGRETDREVLSTTTVREPTTTIKTVGTKEKPKTASSGSFSWPITGRINSYFGGRYIFGSYSYHSGLDIRASYGAPIKAADGGTVTFAGWKGSYGNLVIITHDNGTQTYYGHNSSLVVSAGTKVYKGQVIAKAGSTGRSTGTHCHFEVRVNGTAVNPLSYLN